MLGIPLDYVHHQVEACNPYCKYVPSFLTRVALLGLNLTETLFVEVLEGVGRVDDAWLVWKALTVFSHNHSVLAGNMEAIDGVCIIIIAMWL